jgi:hypothetical protein
MDRYISFTRVITLKLICILTTALIVATPVAFASVSSGHIDPTYHVATVCHDVACTSPAPGSVNFLPTGTSPVLVDDILGVIGVAWAMNLGGSI